MSEFGDVEEIAHQFGHHFSGIVAVVVGEAEPLVVIEEILPHVALHARAHHMPPSGDEILTAVADDVHQQQTAADQPESSQYRFRSFGKESGREQLEDLRKRQIDCADRQSAPHIAPEKSPVRTVIREKFFQNIHDERDSFQRF